MNKELAERYRHLHVEIYKMLDVLDTVTGTKAGTDDFNAVHQIWFDLEQALDKFRADLLAKTSLVDNRDIAQQGKLIADELTEWYYRNFDAQPLPHSR